MKKKVNGKESVRRVILAAPRGYCAGVDRAVITVEKALELYGAPVYVRKQIVHNAYIVRELEKAGAIFVDELDEVPEGSLTIFSAHGVSPAVHQEAKQKNLKTIDATCPLVTKVHNEVKRFTDSGYKIFLIGHEGHEEVEGTSGVAPDNVTVIDGAEEAQEVLVEDDEKIAWLSQTTLSVDETLKTVEALRERVPQLIDPPSDDICYATQNRQEAVKAIASDCDVLIVVGSENSSNSVRLLEVGLESGVQIGYRIDCASEIDAKWFDENVRVVGLTSGASVPDILVQETLVKLSEFGFEHVEVVEKTKEHLLFSLPVELRKDIKEAQTPSA